MSGDHSGPANSPMAASLPVPAASLVPVTVPERAPATPPAWSGRGGSSVAVDGDLDERAVGKHDIRIAAPRTRDLLDDLAAVNRLGHLGRSRRQVRMDALLEVEREVRVGAQVVQP